MSDRYLTFLGALRDHLESFGDPRWPRRLAEWILEFDAARDNRAARLRHYERTRRALGGMGSIADVVIAPEAGHTIANNDRVIAAANDGLLRLVENLDHEVTRLLATDKA